ncbi:secretin N-terminal domain-containing protein [Chitinivibrio alkaliphilus]|uniref:secretin N-terminal domain-containing protein n=1 Tax=Chitinivibrio alkaliphilus TaxID=1505232 RepID=UPI00138AF9FC|nr:secretin N-terminal domain-containing protein [Chitinivibrio alkaliphilus]
MVSCILYAQDTSSYTDSIPSEDSAELSELGSAERRFSRWQWRDTELSSIMNHIAAAANVDIVVAPGVSEKLTLSVHDKTWQEVFLIVCRMADLTYEKMDNYLYVMDQGDFVQRQLRREQDRRNLESIKDLQIQIVELENTVAGDLEDAVGNLLSSRGQVSAVQNTNSLIIEDLPDRIPSIVEKIRHLDKELMQISIEVKIVEVASRVQSDLGVQWSFFNEAMGTGVEHLPGDEGVVAGPLGRASYGILNDDMFRIAMEYLFTETNSKMVAEPHITTLENSEASIFMGANVPVLQRDEAGNSVTQMIPAGTELMVRPTITQGNRINMNLNPLKRSYELTDQGPIITEQGANTHVSVRDGETIVIGGLTADENRESQGGIPLLKDIPIVGFLFRRSEKRVDNNDLVIFVTPHIVKSTYFEAQQEGYDEPQQVHIETGDFEIE